MGRSFTSFPFKEKLSGGDVDELLERTNWGRRLGLWEKCLGSSFEAQQVSWFFGLERYGPLVNLKARLWGPWSSTKWVSLPDGSLGFFLLQTVGLARASWDLSDHASCNYEKIERNPMKLWSHQVMSFQGRRVHGTCLSWLGYFFQEQLVPPAISFSTRTLTLLNHLIKRQAQPK